MDEASNNGKYGRRGRGTRGRKKLSYTESTGSKMKDNSGGE